MRKLELGIGVVVLAVIFAAPVRAQTVSGATVVSSQTSLTLPAGNTTYIYGMATGGLPPSSPFAQGNYQQLTDASGALVADLAVTSSNANSFSTGAEFYTIGGVGVSGFTNMARSFGLNNSPGASSASDAFTVSQSSLVVVVAMAGGQSSLTLSGIAGLQVDAQVVSQSGVIGVVIAHAIVSPGAYTATESSLPAQAAGQDPNHMADLIGVFAFSGGSASVSGSGQKGPTSSTLLLDTGIINGQTVIPTSRTITVAPDAAITGSFTVTINSYWFPDDVMAMGVTPTWGNPATSFTDLGGFTNPAVGLQRTINLNQTAPTTPGTYYVIAAYDPTFTAAQVMSDTNWSAGAAEGLGIFSADWNTGDAIAGWSPSTINTANVAGVVWIDCLQSFGPNETLPVGNGPCYTPATAIKVIVGSGIAPGTFNPSSSAGPSSPTLAPLAIKIDSLLASGTDNQGFLLFSCDDVEHIVDSVVSSIAQSGGAVDAGAMPQCRSNDVGVAGPTKPTLYNLLLDILGGDSFNSFADAQWVAFSTDLENDAAGQVTYVVPPGSSLVIIIPSVQIPTAEPIAVTLSGQYGFLPCSNPGYSCVLPVSGTILNYEVGGKATGVTSVPLNVSGTVNLTNIGQQVSLAVQPNQSNSGVPNAVGAAAAVGPLLSDYAVSSSTPNNPNCPPSITANASCVTSTNSDGGTLSALASGTGSISVVQYLSTDPSTGATFDAQSCRSTFLGLISFNCTQAYFDVRASQGNSFSDVTVDECLTGSGSGTPTVSWWNPQGGFLDTGAYEAIEKQDVENYSANTGCVSFTLTSTTTPSIADLPGAYFRVIAAPPGSTSVHLATTLQSITFDSSSGQYTVALIVSNAGGVTASSVALKAAALNTTGSTTVMPTDLGNLAFGSSALVVLRFPGSAGAPGSPAVLRITETYSGGTAGGGFRVTLPK